MTACILSPLGHITLKEENNALTQLLFTPDQPLFLPTTLLLREAEAQLAAYFQGRLHQFDLPLAPSRPAFPQKVWQGLLRIPYGSTISYGELAELIGCPGGSRAVGGANGKNPLPILIPCHRVIAADGSIGGYSSGIAIKERLLALEGDYLSSSFYDSSSCIAHKK